MPVKIKFALIGAAIAGSLLTGCAGAEHKLPAISEADRARATQEIAAASSLKPTTRTAYENERIAREVLIRLQTAARPICAAKGRGSCWYTLEFSPKGEMNAYVLKNQIVMFNGLAQYLDTDDEFAVVLGHEMGHDISGHYEKAIQNRMAGALITGLIFAGIAKGTNAYQNNPYQAQSDTQTAMKIGAALGDISFSKEHEREADYMAAYLLARADYNPDAAGEVWVKLAKASGRMKTRLFDTHPAGPDRLAAWQQTVDEVRYSTDLMPNLADAKDEPRLQQARIFNDPTAKPSMRETDLALASPSYSSKTDILGNITKALDTSGHSVVSYSQNPVPGAYWVGQGASDNCGVDWAMAVQTLGSRLRGNMWWGGIKYDVYGKLDATGRTRSARAGKSQEAQHMVGPRFFKLDIAFAGDSARGHYAIANLESNCQANFSLGATKSMPNVTNTSDLTDAKALLDELD